MTRPSPFPELRQLMARGLEFLEAELRVEGGQIDNLGFFAAQRLTQVQNLPEWQEAVFAIEQDAVWANHLDKYYQYHAGVTLLSRSCLITSLLFPLIHLSGFAFDEQAFEELYAKMLGFLMAERVEFIAEGMLANVESTAEKIPLQGSLYLVRLTAKQRRKLRHELENVFSLPPEWRAEDTQPSCVLQISLVREKVLSVQKLEESVGVYWAEDVLGRMRQVISAMRLVKEGQVGLPVVVFRNLDWIPEGGPVWAVAASTPAGIPYSIELNDRGAVAQLCGLLERAPQYLDLALRRFDLSYERERPDDRLIDQMICLEALYAKDSRAELSYRLSLRAALATGTDQSDRRTRFDWLRKAYDVRSDIVHGEELRKIAVGTKSIPLHELVSLTEGFVRDSIRFFLSHPLRENQGCVLHAIDDKALSF